jgi:hypothetical protein
VLAALAIALVRALTGRPSRPLPAASLCRRASMRHAETLDRSRRAARSSIGWRWRTLTKRMLGPT